MAVRIENHAEPLPGYRLLERLGGGGFGEVWKCEAPGGLHKAIKFVFGDLSSVGGDQHPAEQELKALSRVKTVRHPYILSLERYDIIDGQLLIVMELADRSLWDRFKECRAQGLPGIPRAELLGYMEEAAEALDLMNQQYQLQHLDIKPQNLFLVHQHIKVADFGLVKDLEGMQASVTGGVTPVYAAPETFDGWVSRFSDQYSLAIVYQELLTGQRPFAGTNVRQLILQHLQAAPNVTPLPPGDQPAVARALSKDPDARYPTCGDLVRALRATAPASDAPAPAVAPLVPPSSLLATGYRQTVDYAPPPPNSAPLAPATVPVPGPAAPSSAPGREGWHGGPPPALSDLGSLARLDTGSSQGTTQCIRGTDAGVLRPANDGKAPPEISGSGTLFPALVIGVGQMGLTVLQRLREGLHARLGGVEQLPNLRLLLLDTDSEVMRAATRGRPGAAFGAGDVVLAPLNRPSHYLKPRDGRPGLESWLNPRMLYRIPRSQVTAGVRALGRLAFCDNYRSLARRLQLELEAVLEPQALQAAAKQTQLGLRSNRPRVYVVCGLGGGTGGGLFLDLAYTLRALLRQAGYDPPDVVGLLLLPPVDGSRTRAMTLGNAFAALTELSYFGSSNTIFQARYHEREPGLQDGGPPFSRCALLPLPDEGDEVATQEVVELSAEFLYRDLTSPLGRAADLGRAGLSAPPWESRGLYYQTFGLFQLGWPRHALLQGVAPRLCQRLVQRWMSKDSKPLRDAVQEWVQEQWQRHELGADSFLQRLQAAAGKALGRPAEDLFASALEPYLRPAAPPARGRAPEPRALSPAELAEALAALEGLVGRPTEDAAVEEGAVGQALREAADRLAARWGQKLAELPVRLIEEPAFRLAGAEEVIRQAVATVEQTLRHHEPLTQDLAARAADAYARLRVLAAPSPPGGRRPSTGPAEVAELLRGYPKWRFQTLLLQRLAGAFVGLRGHLSDELREVNFCRVRLAELLRLFEEAAGASAPRRGGIGRRLFLSGGKDLGEAQEQFLAGVTPEHLLELDGRVEEVLKGRFTALVHVCLTSANVLKNVEAAMLEVARDWAAGQLPATDVGELFFEQHADAEAAEGEVAGFYDEAAPELGPGRGAHGGPPVTELCVLATPPGPAGDRFRELAHRALPEVELHPAASPDDVLLYRERNNLPLSELEQLGPQGHDAYLQMSATENFTPHSRCDVEFKLK